MKTIEDLELMTNAQLRGIATSLGVSVKEFTKKSELVRLVFDVQQPDPQEEKVVDNPRPAPAPNAINDEGLTGELKVFVQHGMTYRIDGDYIVFILGGKTVTTTLRQPVRAMLAVAKQLCKIN